MSEISETQIKSMTKEQNYMRGYEDGKFDVLDKLRAEIKGMTPTYHNPDWSITDLVPISEVLKILDKYKAESEN